MYTDREEFEGWMERIMERFDRTEKLLERVLKKNNTLDGEEVLDNQEHGRCRDIEDSCPAWKQAGIDIHIVRSLNVLK